MALTRNIYITADEATDIGMEFTYLLVSIPETLRDQFLQLRSGYSGIPELPEGTEVLDSVTVRRI